MTYNNRRIFVCICRFFVVYYLTYIFYLFGIIL